MVGYEIPKYYPGQLIWTMLDDVPSEIRIDKIGVGKQYYLQGVFKPVREDFIFPSKESLLN